MRKRISKYKHLHSNRLRYLYSSIPLISVSGLLLVFSLMISGGGMFNSNNSVEAYADEPLVLSDVNYDNQVMALADNVSLMVESTSLSETVANVEQIVSATTNLTVTSSNEYNIYIQETSNNGNLVGQNGGEKVAGMASAAKYSAIPAGSWGYAIAEGAGMAANNTNLTYQAVPSNTTTSAFGGNSASNKDFTLAFAAKFAQNQSADHYKANILISVAATPGEVATLYSVIYNTNRSTSGITPATQTAESDSATYTFRAPMGEDLKKDGYGFAGWSENSNTVTVQYAPDSAITLTAASPNKILYAVWQPTILNTINMTELTAVGCSTSALNETKQLKDTRDSKTYWVTKLADGNCWMTQNLDYDGGGERIYDTSGTNGGPNHSWKNDNTIAQYWDPGKKIVSGSTLIDATDNTDEHLLVGNYYSYAAATNGTAPSGAGEATGSICPTGWTLPSSANFSRLKSSTIGNNGKQLASSPYYFLYGGILNTALTSIAMNSLGGDGYYWSTTASSDSKAYSLSFSSSGVNPSAETNRFAGAPVRCLLFGSED